MENKRFDIDAFRKFREGLGFSQNQFARELGVTPDTIRNYEHGRSQPSGEVIDKIWRKYIIPLNLPLRLYKENNWNSKTLKLLISLEWWASVAERSNASVLKTDSFTGAEVRILSLASLICSCFIFFEICSIHSCSTVLVPRRLAAVNEHRWRCKKPYRFSYQLPFVIVLRADFRTSTRFAA